MVCRLVYWPHIRLQRHQGAVLGFHAEKRELELWLAVVVQRLGPRPDAAALDQELEALEEVSLTPHVQSASIMYAFTYQTACMPTKP